jgi:prepilin-type N-terminal cleavage/methylation domain-containing protein
VSAGGCYPTRAAERGFTLVELMTVVVIMGILAGVGFASLRGHAKAARSAEAIAMIQSIRGAQERWRAEHMMYLDVSTNESWYPRDPQDDASRNIESAFYSPPGTSPHNDGDRWLALRPTVSGPVRYGYLVNAGVADDTMAPTAFGPAVTYPATTPDNWYVIQALGDMDGDGTYSYYFATSLDGAISSINAGD